MITTYLRHADPDILRECLVASGLITETDEGNIVPIGITIDWIGQYMEPCEAPDAGAIEVDLGGGIPAYWQRPASGGAYHCNVYGELNSVQLERLSPLTITRPAGTPYRVISM